MRDWLLIIALSSLISSHLYLKGYDRGTAEVQAEWDVEKAAMLTAQRNKEATLQANMDKLRESYSNETTKLTHAVSTLTLSLRNRPERPAVPASAPTSAVATATGCTGAQLYKTDGEFLVREAARADAIRLALIQCQSAYSLSSKIE